MKGKKDLGLVGLDWILFFDFPKKKKFFFFLPKLKVGGFSGPLQSHGYFSLRNCDVDDELEKKKLK